MKRSKNEDATRASYPIARHRIRRLHAHHSPLRLDRELLVVVHRTEIIRLVQAGSFLHADRTDLRPVSVLEGTAFGYRQEVAIDLEDEIPIRVLDLPRIAFLSMYHTL